MGNRIKELRLKAGLTQQGLADAAGCHRRTVQQWERGENEPRDIYVLRGVAKALKVKHIEDLIIWEDEKK